MRTTGTDRKKRSEENLAAIEANLDITAIIKRAKSALGFKTDSDLAAFLGVSRGTVSNWGARNRTDFHLILSKMGDLDLNWLFTGKSLPPARRVQRPEQRPEPIQTAAGEVQLIHQPKSVEAKDDRSITLYDITAAANLKTLFTNKNQYSLGKILIPNIPACDGAIYVNGDSMYPILKSGDIIGYKELTSLSNIIYGEMYLISFMIDGDEYLTVKYANRSDRPGYMRLVSYNSHHEPMDIPMESINAMAIVKFSVRRHVMM